MARKKTTSWQFKVSSALTILLLLMILGYFVESFIVIRKVKPVTVAIERISVSNVSHNQSIKNRKMTDREKTPEPSITKRLSE